MDYRALYRRANNLIYGDPGLKKAYFSLLDRAKKGTASYSDAEAFADRLASSISAEMREVMADAPEEDLGNFARQFLKPLYDQGQKVVLDVAGKVQKGINSANGIGLKAAAVQADTDRINNMVKRFDVATRKADIEFLCKNHVVKNVMQAAVHDSMQKNAESLEKAGAKVIMIRRTNGKCCDWCESVAGAYAKGYEPDGFWHFHKDCTCSIDYKCTFTGTHTKISFRSENGGLSKIEEDI